MRRFKTFALPALLSAGLLTGCAGTPSAYQYQDKNSYALNVANAAGIGPMQDVKAPAGLTPEQLKALQDGANLAEMVGDSFDAAFMGGAALGAVTMPGIGSGGALAFGVLDLLNTPVGPAASEVNSIAAWMPESLAATPEHAQAKMKQLIGEAAVKTLTESGFKTRPYVDTDVDTVAYWIINEDMGCPSEFDEANWKTDACIVIAKIYQPRLTPTPARVVQHNEPNSYGFVYKIQTKSNLIPLLRVMTNPNSKVSAAALLQLISSELPEWANLYLGTKRTTTTGGKPIAAPYVLNQGKAHFFIQPTQ